MNQSELENKIQVESDKYVLDLENRYGSSEFKNTVITFLKSKPHRLLLLESPDTSVSAWKLLQVLKELQSVPDLTGLNDYLGHQNQTMLKWEKLSEILQSSEAVPKLKNVLACQVEETDEEWFVEDLKLIGTIIERLSFSVKGKIIFIISSIDKEFFREVKSDTSIYFNESENKTMPFYDINTESLIERASIGDVIAVEKILDSGVDVNGTNVNGTTALHEAARTGRIDSALALLRNGAKHLPDKYGITPLHFAARNGHEDVVKLFLENHIDVNIKEDFKQTALHYAAESGHKNSVLTLLKHGANHLPDGNGDTPLHSAAGCGRQEVVELFLENDVDINIKGWAQQTALHYAVRYHHKNLVLTLLKRGAKYFPDKDKETPLHYAAKRGNVDVVKVFLENDVNVNIKGQGGWTALHYAVSYGHKDLIVTLVKKGADINLKNDEGKTALDLAKNQKKKIRLLVENLSKERTH